MSRSDPKVAKQRVDQILADRGLAESRAKAQAYIMAGLVTVAGKKIDKPGHKIASDAVIELKGKDHPWVSRGGIKLEHALRHFDIDVSGMIAMDVGSSTGGFTDVLLTGGAEKVYAVDSGTNQLAWKLRQDQRVVVHEQTSARILTEQHIPEKIDIIVCDASFISLVKVLERPLNFAKDRALLVALVKPQFEAERSDVGKGGVVRDEAVRQAACEKVRDWLIASGWDIMGMTESPITGPKGNVEFLIGAQKSGNP
ncbi:MAG: 23S rRNA (cytidine1920-2'-O)/16S rRNA (cytidine1409-2'-O)-methyltransferase [Parasphingorhabdus sp.]|jgi:23S rRNA (cytidine1920-2'-O)/16S rRNA (cytidine1409-2'-O)-methyltransferase|uniref:TlyA family RNA methyltransferase n=1 Tax=Parasphingorhabdus sp. TaxID=2709688 RepID=UPI002B26AFDF|nr:TlyA family RNA methyltransferase [Parasphingorhabdus sp.]|tara:strand:+ start:703 stop:1467 length:765 start_codon:yes stop_codon:yes gene_type:complete